MSRLNSTGTSTEGWGESASTASGLSMSDAMGVGLVFSPGPNHEERLAQMMEAKELGRNVLLEASRLLLRSVAEMPQKLGSEGIVGLRKLLEEELKLFTRLCEQANVRRDHMLAARYCLCTALDEAANLRPWGGGEGESVGAWSTHALLHTFHGESQGGRTVFLLVGRLANAPQEHMQVLELIYHLISLGFMGDYRTQNDGHRTLETIRYRLYTLITAGREPVPRELSPHWHGVADGKFKLLRSLPVSLSISVFGLALLSMFAWYKYELLTTESRLTKRIDGLAKLTAPATPAPTVTQTAKSKEAVMPKTPGLTVLLASEIRRGLVTVQEDAQRTRVLFSGEGVFGSGSAQPSAATMLALDLLAKTLSKNSVAVIVEGHTSNLSDKSPPQAGNQVLSERRAQAIAKVLVSKGVSESRLQVSGLGDTKPLKSNDSADGRAANRRVLVEWQATSTVAAEPGPEQDERKVKRTVNSRSKEQASGNTGTKN